MSYLWLNCPELTGDKSTLVQVMAWCCQATSHYLCQCWPRFVSPYGVIRPQWANFHSTQSTVSFLPFDNSKWKLSAFANFLALDGGICITHALFLFNFFFQGEYIAPEKIENTYIRSSAVAQVFVHGNSLKVGRSWLTHWYLGVLDWILKMQFSVLFHWLVSSYLLMIMPSDEPYGTDDKSKISSRQLKNYTKTWTCYY